MIVPCSAMLRNGTAPGAARSRLRLYMIVPCSAMLRNEAAPEIYITMLRMGAALGIFLFCFLLPLVAMKQRRVRRAHGCYV
jgi:hypothetical protein